MTDPCNQTTAITDYELGLLTPPAWIRRLDLRLGIAPALVLTWIKWAMIVRLGRRRAREVLEEAASHSGPHLGGYDV